MRRAFSLHEMSKSLIGEPHADSFQTVVDQFQCIFTVSAQTYTMPKTIFDQIECES